MLPSSLGGVDMAFTACSTVSTVSSFRCATTLVCSRRPLRICRNAAFRCVATNPNDVLTSEQLHEWKEVSDLVRTVNSSLKPDDADRLVGRAFGWGTQKFWRGDVKCEAPSLEQARGSLVFLRETVGLDEISMGIVVKKFPEVLRLSLEKMTSNVDQIQRNFPNIKGKMLANSIRDSPSVLGYDFDCEGDCKSECARCWVQF